VLTALAAVLAAVLATLAAMLAAALLPRMLSALAGAGFLAAVLLVGLVVRLVLAALLLAATRIALTLLVVLPLLVRHRRFSRTLEGFAIPLTSKPTLSSLSSFRVPHDPIISNSLRNKEKRRQRVAPPCLSGEQCCSHTGL
jgi:hypothetical protein